MSSTFRHMSVYGPAEPEEVFEYVVEKKHRDGHCSKSRVANVFGIREKEVSALIEHHPLLFVTNEKGIDYKLPEICKDHLSSKGCLDTSCKRLHICAYFSVAGDCGLDSCKCQFGHNFWTSHNTTILSRNQIRYVSEKNLQRAHRDCRQNGATLPTVCTYYNRGKAGCSNSKCRFLHVCEHYLSRTCKFGQRCKRSHNIYDSQPKEILEQYNINTKRSPKEIVSELQSQLIVTDEEPKPKRRRLDSSDVASTANLATTADISADDRKTEICSYFLIGKCTFEAQICRNRHDKSKYRWQYKDSQSSKNWMPFNDTDNDKVEVAFCDPQCNNHKMTLDKGLQVSIDFSHMSATTDDNVFLAVRRLSSVSALKVPPSKATLATRWQWYWKDVNGHFVEYGQQGQTDTANISSDAIEDEYIKNPHGTVYFTTGEHKYKLCFDTMKQHNISTGAEREVRRRPTDVFDKNTARPWRTPPKKFALPSQWGPSDVSGAVKRIKISPDGSTSAEYKRVESKFLKTMGTAKVSMIERVQNEELWEKYSLKKAQMQKKNSGGINEKQLFHGAPQSALKAICEQGFDWRLTGTRTGTMYGKGSYFHKDASYCARYTDCKAIILAKVLVGLYTIGNSSMLRPPPIDSGDPHKLYDSVVDNVLNPGIHVVFAHEQTYPEYIISYN